MANTKSKTENTITPDAANDTPSANREIKDGVFKLLFEKPENAAELYYALTGIKCRPDEIRIITITTVVSGEMKNDLAFIVKDRVLFAGEHQSTPNINMPIRMLMYLGQLYEKLIRERKDKEENFLYSNSLMELPKPEFAVFYNGIAVRPELEILKLSRLFGEDEDSPSSDNSLGLLKLEVPVYNINRGMNTKLLVKGEKLRQYSEFIAKLREFQKVCEDYTDAVKRTVDHCIDNDILSEFLRRNGGKIVSSLFTEYNAETHRRIFARDYAKEKVEERDVEYAKKMLKRNRPIEEIIEDTGLSLESIREIEKTIAVTQ